MNEAKTVKQAGLSPVGAWAFAVGTSIGWGSMVVTSNTYLAQAGPLGSVLGMVLGAAVMLIVSRNYSYYDPVLPGLRGRLHLCPGGLWL